MAGLADSASRADGTADLVWQLPEWPAPENIGALVTGRQGGCSVAPYDSLNLGTHVGDRAASVARNRRLLRSALPDLKRLQWLNQVHGTRAICVAGGNAPLRRRQADAGTVAQPGDGVAVLTADCLPVLFCSRDGGVAAAAHAGWRGLLGGVLENTVLSTGCEGAQLMAWLGPAIGPCCFEVGDEVQAAFLASSRSPSATAEAFAGIAGKPGKSLMNIYAVARQRLQAVSVQAIYGGAQCTVCDHRHFYSYRRDGVTGRMASVVYLKT